MHNSEENSYKKLDPNLSYFIDLQKFSTNIRNDAIEQFNKMYSNSYLSIKSIEQIEEFCSINKVIEIITEFLPYSYTSGDFNSEKQYYVNYTTTVQCSEKIQLYLFYTICNKLVDEGVLELIFDEKDDQFKYRTIKKKAI